MAYSARILLDSVSPAGVRLTTLEVTFPRFVLSEFNTHRMFCLGGATRLYFDLPTRSRGCMTRRYTTTLRDFYEKWHHGAAVRRNKPKSKAAEKVDPNRAYTSKELAAAAGYADVDLLTRRLAMPRIEIPGAPYRVQGLDFIAWAMVEGTNRQPIRDRLKKMQLRSCNEETGEIHHTHVRDVMFSGMKPVFRVRLRNGQQIVSTKDHRFMTSRGWERLEDAVGLTLSPGGIATWIRSAELAVNGVPAVFDPEWLKAQRAAGLSAMVRHFVPVESIEYVGVRETFEIEVEGPYHNFVADGFIVHNSRNSASSRAVPTAKLLERVETDPVLPLEWGRNKAGMSASDVLSVQEEEAAKRIWLEARDAAVAQARKLLELKVHKQELNRVLEPFLWHTVIVTSTEWENFFALRCGPAAQPEIRAAAERMRAALEASLPSRIGYGEWHLPLVQADERGLAMELQKKISAARCARVSYLTHDGKRELEKDFELHDRLRADRHLSPFEHVATPAPDAEFHANFRGWLQMRREIEAAIRPSPVARG